MITRKGTSYRLRERGLGVTPAKARAEADIRGGGEFEAIQDSWPEEIVSVEAVAVEPYPDLE